MAQATVERLWLEVAGRRVALHVVELGLACCGIEVRTARRMAAEAGRVAGEPAGPGGTAGQGDPAGHAGTPGPELHVLVVAGTVTARLAPELAAAYELLPQPRAVLAFGACTATGGPYWDSYAVLPGAHEVVPVDVWVAGCPPRPQDLLAGLEEVLRGRP
jgi:NADH-quinone oxidoreductase subunit B